MVCLKLNRADIAERLVDPLAIVKDFNELKDGAVRLSPALKRALVNQLILQRAKETLGHRIVIAVPAATHTGHDAMPRQQLTIGGGRILTTLIGMMNQAGRRLAAQHRHREGMRREMSVGARTHGRADDAARVQIQHHLADGSVHLAEIHWMRPRG